MTRALIAGWTMCMEGIPLPYSLQMDNYITTLLLCCFLVTAYILSRSSKFLLKLVKDFILHRERDSIFDTSTAADMRYLLLLVIQTCVLLGIILFNYFNETVPELRLQVGTATLLGIYIGGCLLYIFLKWLLYSFLGWIFFDKNRISIWSESYFTLLYYLGFILFPFTLSVVYLNINLQTMVLISIILLILIKILIFYKWLNLFCKNLYGGLFLFLYFCALEIVPFFVMYRGLIQLIDFLIIKF